MLKKIIFKNYLSYFEDIAQGIIDVTLTGITLSKIVNVISLDPLRKTILAE